MDKKQLGTMLSAALPSPVSSISDLMNDDSVPLELEGILASISSPSVIFGFPKSYRNRKGFRVDVCGLVDLGTKEYDDGYYMFDSCGCMYLKDGRINLQEDDDSDLTSVMSTEDKKSSHPPFSPFIWVHPQHYTLKSFFQKLTPGKVEVKVGNHYLNRMGLAIEIITVTSEGIFRDIEDRPYTKTGFCLSHPPLSMVDLVYEIKAWPLFIRSSWSSDIITTVSDVTNDIPELFNPVSANRQLVMEEFFRVILRANELAKQLELKFGFHMDLEASKHA